MKNIICITGTPGTGKTEIAMALAKKLGYKRLNLNAAIKKEKLYSGYDKIRKCWIADMGKVNKYVKEKTKEGGWVIDSHLAHFLQKRLVDIVIVLRCEPSELKKRLKRKKWTKAKINENYEAELIGLIAWEAKKHKNVFELDTAHKSVNRIVGEIEKLLKRKDKG